MIKKVVLYVLLCANLIAFSSATADIYDDDSCTNTTTLLNRLIVNLTTAGFFSFYSASFYMDGAPDTQTTGSGCDANYYCKTGNNTCTRTQHNSKYCTQGESGCDNDACDPNGGLRFCYYTLQSNLTYGYSCYDVQNGWGPAVYVLPPATIRAVNIADQLCVQFWTLLGYQTIGCKYLPDCSKFAMSSSCYVAQSCSSNGFQYSMGMFPMTSMIVQCVKESMQRLFVNVSECNDGSSTYQTNYFPAFQNSMRRAVRSALILYIILFGIKMALAGDMPDKGEFFKFGAKYVLVLYFSVGMIVGYDGKGTPIYSDGFQNYMIPLFENGSTELANMVYQASGATGLCSYPPPNTSYQSGYSYLSFWDSLDCRILYYLGLDLTRITNVTGAIAPAAFASMLGAPFMFTMLLPAIMSGQIIFAIFSIVFCVFVVSIMIYILNITILSIIAMAILIYMAPIFVPMALFEPTKSYYDNWLKLLISYALQPMVMTAFMAMMITVFDQTMFGDCQFNNNSITIDMGNGNTKVIPYFELCDPHAGASSCQAQGSISGLTKCSDTLGYFVNPVQSSRNVTKQMLAIFFPITILNENVVTNLFPSMVTLCLFAYLFYKFSAILGGFAEDLTGGTNLGKMAGNPMKIVDAAASMAKAAVQFAAGDKEGAAATAMKGYNTLKGDKKAQRLDPNN